MQQAFAEIQDKLKNLFRNWSGQEILSIKLLPASGSERRYYRIKGKSRSAIGVYHPIAEESRAFLGFSAHFLNLGLNVPGIYAKDIENDIYLLQDLGDTTLFSILEDQKKIGGFNKELEGIYKNVLAELVRFQVEGGKELDYSLCYPRADFDRQSMLWDLNYFKYYFLRPKLAFNEQLLEDDFLRLTDWLSECESDFFMYRDFQSRNIMMQADIPYFIDYQGGRRGPLQYDVASLLFQVKAEIPFDVRERLLDYYLNELKKHIPTDEDIFRMYYSGFVLMRLLQVLGAYGFRGLIEKKKHFLTSIPYALENLKWWLENFSLPVNLPELIPALEKLVEINTFPKEVKTEDDILRVDIRSFSYRKGIPEDNMGNGGGFVFDCRGLPNPGREERYRAYTGRDPEVIQYLQNLIEVQNFLDNIYGIIDQSVDVYQDRHFNSLVINFGCTGGQHRSVYCAEQLAKHLQNKSPGVIVTLEHTVIDNPDNL